MTNLFICVSMHSCVYTGWCPRVRARGRCQVSYFTAHYVFLWGRISLSELVAPRLVTLEVRNPQQSLASTTHQIRGCRHLWGSLVFTGAPTSELRSSRVCPNVPICWAFPLFNSTASGILSQCATDSHTKSQKMVFCLLAWPSFFTVYSQRKLKETPDHNRHSERGPGRCQQSWMNLHSDSRGFHFLIPQDGASGQPPCSTFLLGISASDFICLVLVYSPLTWRELHQPLMLTMRIKCPNMKTAWHTACSNFDMPFCWSVNSCDLTLLRCC